MVIDELPKIATPSGTEAGFQFDAVMKSLDPGLASHSSANAGAARQVLASSAIIEVRRPRLERGARGAISETGKSGSTQRKALRRRLNWARGRTTPTPVTPSNSGSSLFGEQ